jgi:hypothetical protein
MDENWMQSLRKCEVTDDSWVLVRKVEENAE